MADLVHFEVASIYGAHTQQGLVELTLNDHDKIQMDLPKAREIVGMLQGAIEAAISDELLWKFLTNKVGIKPEAAAVALLDFREFRQGSRKTVYPQ
jgi:hypothetical protein